SNALAIAQRLGLPQSIIESAKAEINPLDLRADKLLDDIRKERNRTSREREKLEKARIKLEKQTLELEKRLEKIEDERRETLAKARAEGELEVAVLKSNIDSLKSQLKKAKQPLDAIKSMEEKIEEIEKPPYKDFLKLLNISISKYQSVEDFIANLENAKNVIRSLSKNAIFEKLNSTPDGKASLNSFISSRFKGVCSYDGIAEYINKIKGSNQPKNLNSLNSLNSLKNNDLCPSCQERKAEYEFNNAVSNIIGFNKDNSNWIWGFKASKLKICPLCAL
ncbi:MAG: hypothetical protein ACK40V_11500, partial [Anaerolineales bacterium]